MPDREAFAPLRPQLSTLPENYCMLLARPGAHHVTLRTYRRPNGKFSQGVVFTQDLGNEIYAEWLQHVA